jgi:hypothetical protein
MLAKKRGGGPGELSLFVCTNCCGGPGVAIGASKSNFDENEGPAVQHYKVYFALPAAIIPGYGCQPAGCQMRFRQLLGQAAY